MKTKLCLLLLVALCLGLAACGTMYPPRKRGPQSRSDHEPDPYRATTVTLWSNRYDYDLGEPVIIRWTVKNTSGRHLVLTGEGEPAIDIVVMGGEPYGEWRWAEGKTPTEAPTRLELEPGQSRTIEWTWMPPQEQQWSYSVYGIWWRSDGLRGEERLSIQVAWLDY